MYIVQDGQVLLIERQRNGRLFYVVPGGGVEPGETWAEAAVREAWEETRLTVELGPVLHELDWRIHEIEQTERAYLVTAFQGEPQMVDPEILANASEFNQYRLAWVALHQLAELPCYPPIVDYETLQRALNGQD